MTYRNGPQAVMRIDKKDRRRRRYQSKIRSKIRLLRRRVKNFEMTQEDAVKEMQIWTEYYKEDIFGDKYAVLDWE